MPRTCGQFGTVVGRKSDATPFRFLDGCLNELLNGFEDILHSTLLLGLSPLKRIQSVSQFLVRGE
jgi:hypothetical protein